IILAGRVEVNGHLVQVLGTKIDPRRDRVTVDGAPVKPRRKLYVAVNKPRGYICSRHDRAKRRAVGDLLPKEWDNLYPVGRLDYESEGLIFLTNDGEFCLQLTHPRYGVRKKYLATVEGRVEPKVLGERSEERRVGKKRNVKKRPACSELRWAYCNHKATYLESYLTGGDCVPADQH